MLDFVRGLFDSSFLPHGHCYQWQPELLWLHAGSDALIALAFYTIPLMLAYVIARRKDLAFRRIVVLFGLFILACGTTHLLEIWSIWNGTYRLTGSVKLLTAGLSVTTAALMMPLLPKMIGFPSPSQLRHAHDTLLAEVQRRRAAEEALHRLNQELEVHVEARTAELERLNADLRQQMAARREAEAQTARLAAIVAASEDAITRQTLDGIITDWNAGAEKLYGFTAEEAIGQPILILVPPGLEPEVTALLEQSARGEAIRTLETIRQTKHGRRFDASVSVAPIRDEEDRVVAISTIERDISRSKRIEGALRRSRTKLREMNRTLEARVEERTGELRRANYALKLRNRELEDFTHIASHDLQEPLRKIHTFADLLQEEYREHFDGHADYYLNRIQDSAGRMSRLINDLLSFSRVTMRGRPFEQVDLNVTAAEVMADLELAVAEADAHVEVAPLPVLVADRTQMHQLLQNLVQNAIKYRRPGIRPEVRVTADVMESDGLPGHATLEVVRLHVTDNGVGFDPQYCERIFAPFERLHADGIHPGTGMGLAICRRIAERHGGTINASSTPGEGSTFVVTLPRRPATPTAQPPARHDRFNDLPNDPAR